MNDPRNPVDREIHPLIAARWSPYAYDERAVETADLAAVFEAARWAASAFNEQPWRYIVATREEPAEYERLLSCLVEGNRTWAGRAPVLALGVVSRNFARNGKPNGSAEHDLGLASAHLTLEAVSRGLVVHQMGGILPDRARELYGIPEGYDAFTGIAIGYAAEPDAREVPEALRERDVRPRRRRSLEETVFRGKWGQPGVRSSSPSSSTSVAPQPDALSESRR